MTTITVLLEKLGLDTYVAEDSARPKKKSIGLVAVANPVRK